MYQTKQEETHKYFYFSPYEKKLLKINWTMVHVKFAKAKQYLKTLAQKIPTMLQVLKFNIFFLWDNS